MEGIGSSPESFELLRIMLSFTSRAEFRREGYDHVHMALFYSALALCFWGFVVTWWRKYAQSVYVLSLSPCLPFKWHQIQSSRVPAMMFNPTKSVLAEENESGRRGKILMRFQCSIESPKEVPAHDFSQNGEASVAAECENYATSFSSSCDKQILGVGNYRNYEEACLERPKSRDLYELLLQSEEIVKCFDVSHSGELLAGGTVDSINTVRLWDVPARKCVNYMKLNDDSIVAEARFSSSSNLNLLSGIAIAEHCKSSLYLWDTRNFPKPLSFSLGKKSRLDIMEFNDKKVYVCDDLSEGHVFDLRMAGAPVLEVYRETRPQLRKGCNLKDFHGLCASSLLQ